MSEGDRTDRKNHITNFHPAEVCTHTHTTETEQNRDYVTCTGKDRRREFNGKDEEKSWDEFALEFVKWSSIYMEIFFYDFSNGSTQFALD